MDDDSLEKSARPCPSVCLCMFEQMSRRIGDVRGVYLQQRVFSECEIVKCVVASRHDDNDDNVHGPGSGDVTSAPFQQSISCTQCLGRNKEDLSHPGEGRGAAFTTKLQRVS